MGQFVGRAFGLSIEARSSFAAPRRSTPGAVGGWRQSPCRGGGVRSGMKNRLTSVLVVDPDVRVAPVAGDHGRYRLLQEAAGATLGTLGLLQEGRFRFRTLVEARDLSLLLANAFPEPQRVVVGIAELLINAVEHGNLGLGYAAKTALHASQRWEEEIERRLRDPASAHRCAEASLRRDEDSIRLRVADEGEGFDWRPYLEVDPQRAADVHGRGIAVARLLCFDRLEYLGCGNVVVATVLTGPSA